MPRDEFSLQPALARGMREGIPEIGPTDIVVLLQLDDEQVICSRRKASSASFRRITVKVRNASRRFDSHLAEPATVRAVGR